MGRLRSLRPSFGGLAKIFDTHLQERRRKILEANQRLVNHPHRPLGLTEISEQAKRRRQLNQTFEKRPILQLSFLVQILQDFVAGEKLPVVK